MIQQLINWKTIALATFIVLVGLSSLQVLQTPERILDDVTVEEEGSMVILNVKTNIPLRYEDHFPESPSNFIQIKVRAISFSGGDGTDFMGNESILPGFVEQVPIMDVAYEGSVKGGPFISLRFKEPVSYQIKEDPDLNGVQIFIPKSTRN